MIYRFTCDRLPSLNEYIRAERSGWQAANNMKHNGESTVIYGIRRAHLKRIKGPVRIRYVFFEKDRRRDKDNIAGIAHKFVQDALVKSGILENDSWNYVTGFSDEFQIDKKNPRIEVELIEVNDGR